MPTGKDKPPSHIDYRKLIILFLLALALSLLSVFGIHTFHTAYQPGDIARENIKSPADTSVPKSDMTIKRGEIVVREGERISEEHLQKAFCHPCP